MRRFFNIPRGKHLLIWPPVIAALFVAASLLALSAWRIVWRALEVRRERLILEEKLEELKAEKAKLEARLGAAGSAEVIEKMAKEKLNLKKPEEEVVVIPLQRETDQALQRQAGFGLWSMWDWLGSLTGFW